MEILLVWILVGGACGMFGGLIASARGGSGAAGFFLGLFFGPLGVIISFFIGTEEGRKQVEFAEGGAKKCPRCAEIVKKEALVCRFCGHEFASAVE